MPYATASSSFPLSKAVFDDSSSCLPSAEEHAACCKDTEDTLKYKRCTHSKLKLK